LADCLAHAALGAITLLAWLGLGSVFLARAPRVADPVLDLLNRVGLGVLAFALLTFAAGWAHLLYTPPYLALFAVSAAFGVAEFLPWIQNVPRPQLRSWPRWQRALFTLILIYVAIDVIAVSAPISSPDALLYHAADPALFVKAHRIFAIPWNSSSYEPFSVEMLVLDGFLLWNAVQGAFAPLLLALLAAGVISGFAMRIGGRSAALLSAAIFFAQPFMVWEATSTFIEPGIAMMLALAAWNLVQFLRRADTISLVLAGVFAGGAAGIKYVGLIAAVVLAATSAVVLARRLNGRLALTFCLPAIAVALPWYVKNALLTGNPFYPFVFGGLNAAAAGELSATTQTFGYGHGLVDFLLLPARLLAAAKPFDGGQYLSPLFLIFAPVALLLNRTRAAIFAAAGGVMLYVVAWFLTTQQARFLLPLMPTLAVLAALGMLALARETWLGRQVTIVVTTSVLAVSLGASAVYAKQFVPVVFGGESKEQFLYEKVSDFAGIEWLNRNLGARAKVATDIWGLLYLRMPYVTFGTQGDLLAPDAGPSATRGFVAKYRITDIAILDGDGARLRQVGYLPAHLIARVSVRSVESRTRGHFGPPHDMLIYALSA
jgi:hypothetical protein